MAGTPNKEHVQYIQSNYTLDNPAGEINRKFLNCPQSLYFFSPTISTSPKKHTIFIAGAINLRDYPLVIECAKKFTYHTFYIVLPQWEELQKQCLHLKNIIILPHLPFFYFRELILSCEVVFIPLHKGEIRNSTNFAKIAYHLPTVTITTNNRFNRHFIKNKASGLLYEAENLESAKQAIQWTIDNGEKLASIRQKRKEWFLKNAVFEKKLGEIMKEKFHLPC